MMKKCATCGWWFESSDARKKYCDRECRKEAQRISRLLCKQKKMADATEKHSAILKIRPDKLPKPPRAPTREYRGKTPQDRTLQSL